MKLDTWAVIEDVIKAGGVHRNVGTTSECYVCLDEHEKPHRDDGPAIVWLDGAMSWMQHGVIHRHGGGPATIDALGHPSYYRNGNLILVF